MMLLFSFFISFQVQAKTLISAQQISSSEKILISLKSQEGVQFDVSQHKGKTIYLASYLVNGSVLKTKVLPTEMYLKQHDQFENAVVAIKSRKNSNTDCTNTIYLYSGLKEKFEKQSQLCLGPVTSDASRKFNQWYKDTLGLFNL